MARTITNNSFYLHLDSSIDDRDVFIDNKLGDFTQILPDAIYLECEDDEHWEIALEELILPNALNNIYPGTNEFEYSIIVDWNYDTVANVTVPQTNISQVFTGAKRKRNMRHALDIKEMINEVPINPYKITVPFNLAAGYYDNLSITSAINKKVKKIKKYLLKNFNNHGLKKENMHFQIKYSPITRKMSFYTCPKSLEQLTVKNEKLKRILGLESESYPQYPKLTDYRTQLEERPTQGEFNAPLQPNLNRHFQKIIIYCDIAQESVLNDKYVSLLRVFDISTLLNSTYSSNQHVEENKQMPLTCINPHIERLHFYPVSTNVLQEISIKIANEFGEDLIFCETKDVTNVLLFFKKIKNGAFNTI